MTDILTRNQRSFNMSQIKSKNTRPEILIRSLLFKAGYRYRVHVKKLPGKPDIVFPKRKKIIQVNGCFWHYHNCKFGKVKPLTNANFWESKRQGNKKRDFVNLQKLKAGGWKVLAVWECQITNPDNFEKIINFLKI